MNVYYDPTDPFCKSEIGAVTENKPVRLTIRIEGASDCKLSLRWDETGEGRMIPADRRGDLFTVTLPVLPVGLYF